MKGRGKITISKKGVEGNKNIFSKLFIPVKVPGEKSTLSKVMRKLIAKNLGQVKEQKLTGLISMESTMMMMKMMAAARMTKMMVRMTERAKMRVALLRVTSKILRSSSKIWSHMSPMSLSLMRDHTSLA